MAKTAHSLVSLALLVSSLFLFFFLGNKLSGILVPSPGQLTSFLLDRHALYRVLSACLQTAGTVAASTILALAWSLPIGIALGLRMSLRNATTTTVDFLRSIPPSALIPAAILFLGTGRFMFLALTSFALGLILVVLSREALSTLPPLKLRMMTAARWHLPRRAFCLYIPSVLSHLESSAQILVSLGMALVVVCEILIGRNGLGSEIRLAQYRFQTPALYTNLLAAGVVGVLLNAIVRFLFTMIERFLYRPLRFSDEA